MQQTFAAVRLSFVFRRVLLVSIGLLLTSTANAQQMGVRYDHIGRSTVIDADTENEASISHFSARLGVPVRIDEERWMVVPGVAFERAATRLDPHEDFVAYTFGGSLTLVHQRNERWGAVGHLALSYQSDLQGHDGRAWTGVASLMATLRLAEHHRVRFGAALSYARGRWTPVPVIGWDLRRPWWTLNVAIPTSGRFAGRPHEDFDIGPELRFGGGGAQVYDLGFGSRSMLIEGGVSARYRILGPIYAVLFGGATLYHRAVISIDGGGELVVRKRPAPVVSLGILLMQG